MGLDWITGAGKLVGVALMALIGSCAGVLLARWQSNRATKLCPACKGTTCDLVFRCPRCHLFRDVDA